MEKFTTEGADKILDLKGGVPTVYTLEQKQVAVETYLKLGSLRKTIRNLGYPGARATLQPLDEDGNPYVPCNIDEIAGRVKVVEISEVSKHYE